MCDYAIVTDSTCDLPHTLVQQLDITVIPMAFTVDDQTYIHYPDERELSAKAFYHLLRQGYASVTGQITISGYLDVFDRILAQGRDILNLCFSSALSGSFNSCCVAARELSEKYPRQKIHVVDTKAASLGEGLLVYHAAMRRQQGCALEELKTWVEENRNRFCHWFTVDDLHYLRRGGRISATARTLGTLLSVKPVLHVDDEGRLVLMEKARGRKNALGKLVDAMEKSCVRPEEQTVFIGHGDCAADAEYLAHAVRRRMPVRDIITGFIGPVIGSHTGPGMVGLFYRGTEK